MKNTTMEKTKEPGKPETKAQRRLKQPGSSLESDIKTIAKAGKARIRYALAGPVKIGKTNPAKLTELLASILAQNGVQCAHNKCDRPAAAFDIVRGKKQAVCDACAP